MQIKTESDEISIEIVRFQKSVSKTIDEWGMASGETVVLNAQALKILAIDYGMNTASEAWQVWIAFDEIAKKQKERCEAVAEVAYWYKINPFDLEEQEIVGLLSNIDRMKCRDRIDRGDYSPTDYEGIYYLYRTAFGDESLAHKKKTEAFGRFVDQKAKQNKGR